MVNKKKIKEENDEKEFIELKHKLKMEELTYLRETERLKHEWELERGRIKSAEIKKSQMRRFGEPFKI